VRQAYSGALSRFFFPFQTFSFEWRTEGRSFAAAREMRVQFVREMVVSRAAIAQSEMSLSRIVSIKLLVFGATILFVKKTKNKFREKKIN